MWTLPLAADLCLIVFVRLCQAIGVAVASDCAVVLHLSDARQCPRQHQQQEPEQRQQQ